MHPLEGMLCAGEMMCVVKPPRDLKEVLTLTLHWGDIFGDTRRKRRLKMLRLEAVGLGLSPIVRQDRAAQGVASQRVLFQGNAVLRSKGNYGCFVFWNLAVLCKTIPSFCPGSLAALLGGHHYSSKERGLLDFFFFFFFLKGCWK